MESRNLLDPDTMYARILGDGPLQEQYSYGLSSRTPEVPILLQGSHNAFLSTLHRLKIGADRDSVRRNALRTFISDYFADCVDCLGGENFQCRLDGQRFRSSAALHSHLKHRHLSRLFDLLHGLVEDQGNDCFLTKLLYADFVFPSFLPDGQPHIDIQGILAPSLLVVDEKRYGVPSRFPPPLEQVLFIADTEVPFNVFTEEELSALESVLFSGREPRLKFDFAAARDSANESHIVPTNEDEVTRRKREKAIIDNALKLQQSAGAAAQAGPAPVTASVSVSAPPATSTVASAPVISTASYVAPVATTSTVSATSASGISAATNLFRAATLSKKDRKLRAALENAELSGLIDDVVPRQLRKILKVVYEEVVRETKLAEEAAAIARVAEEAEADVRRKIQERKDRREARKQEGQHSLDQLVDEVVAQELCELVAPLLREHMEMVSAHEAIPEVKPEAVQLHELGMESSRTVLINGLGSADVHAVRRFLKDCSFAFFIDGSVKIRFFQANSLFFCFAEFMTLSDVDKALKHHLRSCAGFAVSVTRVAARPTTAPAAVVYDSGPPGLSSVSLATALSGPSVPVITSGTTTIAPPPGIIGRLPSAPPGVRTSLPPTVSSAVMPLHSGTTVLSALSTAPLRAGSAVATSNVDHGWQTSVIGTPATASQVVGSAPSNAPGIWGNIWGSAPAPVQPASLWSGGGDQWLGPSGLAAFSQPLTSVLGGEVVQPGLGPVAGVIGQRRAVAEEKSNAEFQEYDRHLANLDEDDEEATNFPDIDYGFVSEEDSPKVRVRHATGVVRPPPGLVGMPKPAKVYDAREADAAAFMDRFV